MRRLFITVVMVCFTIVGSAQIITYSSCDSNVNGEVDVTDVTNTANKVLKKSAEEKNVVTAENLNSAFTTILDKLSTLESKLSAIDTRISSFSAQQESAFIDAVALLGEQAVDNTVAVVGGTKLCKSASVTMKAAYDCDYKIVPMTYEDDPFNSITIDGVSYENVVKGIQGQRNPTNTKVASTQQPVDNSIFQFDVTEDGYLYVFTRFSANKQYYAFKGAYSESTPSSSIAYTVVGGSQKDGDVYKASLPGDKDGYADYSGYANAETIGTYFLCDLLGIRATYDANYGTNTFAEVTHKANILGVAAFPVYKEAGTYYFHAVGSKVLCDGFVFIPGAKRMGTVTVTNKETDLGN